MWVVILATLDVLWFKIQQVKASITQLNRDFVKHKTHREESFNVMLERSLGRQSYTLAISEGDLYLRELLPFVCQVKITVLPYRRFWFSEEREYPSYSKLLGRQCSPPPPEASSDNSCILKDMFSTHVACGTVQFNSTTSEGFYSVMIDEVICEEACLHVESCSTLGDVPVGKDLIKPATLDLPPETANTNHA
ncbi:hypothetical protein GIB67_029598 [Kingdonia uniflora]|uniref:Uncharacterized protein n=1 Tax=Kingdonia uniflora TaxID=39325 RepID=A0A7J7LLI4_9MAGN|nr:hypothetical protein GIB67_029598 [Kingdonia uniflora]